MFALSWNFRDHFAIKPTVADKWLQLHCTNREYALLCIYKINTIKISNVKSLLYKSNTQCVYRILSQTLNSSVQTCSVTSSECHCKNYLDPFGLYLSHSTRWKEIRLYINVRTWGKLVKKSEGNSIGNIW